MDVRIRPSGFLANRRRKQLLPFCQQLLNVSAVTLRDAWKQRDKAGSNLVLLALRRRHGAH
jgi:hypothetical protein